MKTCQHCAEEVQDQAVKCKHCKYTLKTVPAQPGEPFHKTFTGKLLLAGVGLVFGLPMFLIFISAFIDGLVETTPSQKLEFRHEIEQYVEENEPAEYRYTFDDLFHESEFSVNLIEPQSIRFDSENNIATVPLSEYGNEETIDLEKAALVATDQRVAFYREEQGTGSFNDYEYALITFTDPNNEEKIGWIQSPKLFPEDQLSLIEEYNNSSIGQLCAEHTSWEYVECKKVTEGKIWIGMDLNMLKEERGIPDSANPSNYGSGTRWQWCWHDYNPSCFYGEDDGIIDAYN